MKFRLCPVRAGRAWAVATGPGGLQGRVQLPWASWADRLGRERLYGQRKRTSSGSEVENEPQGGYRRTPGGGQKTAAKFPLRTRVGGTHLGPGRMLQYGGPRPKVGVSRFFDGSGPTIAGGAGGPFGLCADGNFAVNRLAPADGLAKRRSKPGSACSTYGASPS